METLEEAPLPGGEDTKSVEQKAESRPDPKGRYAYLIRA